MEPRPADPTTPSSETPPGPLSAAPPAAPPPLPAIVPGEVPDLPAHPETGGPVMVVALDGFLDAGNAGKSAVSHLLDRSGDGGRVVASFDVDALHDYRARRPAISFVEDHYERFDAPRLVVRLMHDRRGSAYLLLHGPEPDIRWEGFAAAVRQVVDHFGVRLVVSLGSVPMAAPHTRPVMVTNHATRPDEEGCYDIVMEPSGYRWFRLGGLDELVRPHGSQH